MLTLKAPSMNLGRSLSCGQAFRWHKLESEEAAWRGVVGDRCVIVRQGVGEILLERPLEEEEDWIRYFSLDKDYGELENLLEAEQRTQGTLKSSAGIHIFQQEPFETAISFVVSANNNVKRITSILEKMAERYGAQGYDERGVPYHAFPQPDVLANATEEELKTLGAGYRATYIQNTARKVAEGFDFCAVRVMDRESASKTLQTLPGVGPKVAACIMLFSLGFEESCPMDVWMKRVLADRYAPLGEKEAMVAMEGHFGRWTGAAQQYLFHHARMNKKGKHNA